jgi:hypothetical protein
VAIAHVAVLLADGGDCLSDLAVLRDEPDRFGLVASDSTALRALESGWAAEAIIEARRVARDTTCGAGAAPETVTLELDATLLDAHSDKEDAAPTYKAGYGFHPLCAVSLTRRTRLAGTLRSGNAGANNAEDHVEVLDAAISQLPGEWRSGMKSERIPTPSCTRSSRARTRQLRRTGSWTLSSSATASSRSASRQTGT